MRLSEKGFSIIEILLGVSVFAIGLMGVLALLMSSVNSNAFASRLSEASFLGSSQLEALMRLPYGDAALLDTDADLLVGLHHVDAEADGSRLNVSGNSTTYDVFWNNAEEQPVANSTTVCVTVVWFEKGERRQVSVAGVKAREGV
ncbi:MAG: hypothetical protein HGA96_00305 [Desulfobulbaceae bacterium]|nr:hypothetical protein [Desulfobulbaceae bacterium]